MGQAMSENNSGTSFSCSDDLIGIVHKSGPHVWLSPGWEEALGYSQAELHGVRLLDFLHPDDAKHMREAMRRLADKGASPSMFTNRCRAADGSYRWIEWRPSSPRDDVVYASARDVTAEKEPRTALQRSEAVLAQEERVAQMGSWRMQLETSTRTMSDGFCLLFGFDPQTLGDLGPAVAEVMRPSDYANARALCTDVLADGVPREAEYRLTIDGRFRWMRAQVMRESDDAGQALALVGVVQDVTEQNAAEDAARRTNRLMAKMVRDVTEAMGRVVGARDPYTRGHEERVAELARAIAVEMGLSEEMVSAVEIAAFVHDVGKMGVPAEFLTKPGLLTSVEHMVMREHSRVGYEILKDIAFPWPIADIVIQHHERIDGSGYPSGLSGDEILLEARILAVADVVEAMASDRPYRPALGIEIAIAEIVNKPHLYDSEVTAACSGLLERGEIQL
jgi:PAS domain S-box-containing protein/putative nucleotidyltransferase with HDIG domain